MAYRQHQSDGISKVIATLTLHLDEQDKKLNLEMRMSDGNTICDIEIFLRLWGDIMKCKVKLLVVSIVVVLVLSTLNIFLEDKDSTRELMNKAIDNILIHGENGEYIVDKIQDIHL